MQGLGIHNPLRDPDRHRLQGNALIAPAKHGSFAPAVDQYERLRARSSLNGDDLGLYACAGECLLMKSRRSVVAQDSDVARRHAPVLTSHDGGCDLAPRQNVGRTVFNFGTPFRVICEGNERVCRVQAHTDKVNLGRLSHLASVNAALRNPKTFVHLARLVFQ